VLELLCLIYDCLRDNGMAMADRDSYDAGEGIEVSFASFVKEVLHFAVDDHDWGFEVVEDGWVEVGLAEGEDLCLGRACPFRRNVGVKGRKGGNSGEG